MKITPTIITLLLFGGIMLGISQIFAGTQSAYNPGGILNETTFSGYQGIMDRTNKTMSQLEDATAGFVNKPVTDLTKYYDATLIFLGVLGIIAQMPGMALSYAQLTFSLIPGLPGWFILMISTIIITFFVMIIVAVATKRDDI